MRVFLMALKLDNVSSVCTQTEYLISMMNSMTEKRMNKKEIWNAAILPPSAPIYIIFEVMNKQVIIAQNKTEKSQIEWDDQVGK